MTKAIQTVHLSATLSLSERKDGWWIYDKVLGMNIAMHCNTERAAFTKALTYYQKRNVELVESENYRREFMENLYNSLFEEFGDYDAIEFAANYR